MGDQSSTHNCGHISVQNLCWLASEGQQGGLGLREALAVGRSGFTWLGRRFSEIGAQGREGAYVWLVSIGKMGFFKQT